jgi:hypothetical protein
MKKRFLLCILSLPLLAMDCHRKCDKITIKENGPLSEEALLLVPYQSGEDIKFIHSEGKVINFKVSRSTTQETFICDHDCCLNVNYEDNQTKLQPDYPIFSIWLNLSNFYPDMVEFYINIGGGYFELPPSPALAESFSGLVDSVVVRDQVYRNVLQMKSFRYTSANVGEIYVDSMYYNYEAGIIKIIMSNNESYEIYK